MRRYFINFRKTVRDRAAEMSTRAYNHYRRFGPLVGKVYLPFKAIHAKYLGKFYGQGKKG